ncbi:MAG: redoxin domain-containing protein [Deltaproteobacteria bacterium]
MPESGTDQIELAGGGHFDLQGADPSLLVVYKSSCPTCRLLLPLIEESYRRSGTELAVFLVSQDDRETTAAFIDELGLTVPVLLDAPGYGLSVRVGLPGVPMTVRAEAGQLGEPIEGFDRMAIRELAAGLAAAGGLPEDLVAPFDAPDLPDFRPG